MRPNKMTAALLSIALSLSALVGLTGCSSAEPVESGNVEEVSLEAGDVFAVIKIKDYGDITVKLFPNVAPKAVEKFIALSERGYYDGRNIHRIIKDYLFQGGSLNGDGSDGIVNENEYIDVETSPLARNFYGALCFASSAKGNYCQFYVVASQEKFDIDATAAKLEEQLADTSISERLTEDKKTYITGYMETLKNEPAAVKEKYLQTGGIYALDGTTTVFGQTIEGYDIIEKICAAEVVSGNDIDDSKDIDSKPMNQILIETVEIVRIPDLTATTTTTEATTEKKPKKTTAETTAEPDDTVTTTTTQGVENFDTTTTDVAEMISTVSSATEAPVTTSATTTTPEETTTVWTTARTTVRTTTPAPVTVPATTTTVTTVPTSVTEPVVTPISVTDSTAPTDDTAPSSSSSTSPTDTSTTTTTTVTTTSDNSETTTYTYFPDDDAEIIDDTESESETTDYEELEPD